MKAPLVSDGMVRFYAVRSDDNDHQMEKRIRNFIYKLKKIAPRTNDDLQTLLSPYKTCHVSSQQ